MHMPCVLENTCASCTTAADMSTHRPARALLTAFDFARPRTCIWHCPLVRLALIGTVTHLYGLLWHRYGYGTPYVV